MEKKPMMNTTTNLRMELKELEARSVQLNGDARDARKRLNDAREAVVEGTGMTADLMRAQSESDALSGAVEALASKIAAKLREIDAAQTGENRLASIEELQIGAADFDGDRSDAREIAERLAAVLAELPTLYTKMREADQLRDRLIFEAEEAGLEAEWEGYGELKRAVPGVSLQAETLDLISDPAHRQSARQMLETERQHFYNRDMDKWRESHGETGGAATGGAATAISPGLLPSGTYQPRAAAAV
jgi:chromosome segregation ATPase